MDMQHHRIYNPLDLLNLQMLDVWLFNFWQKIIIWIVGKFIVDLTNIIEFQKFKIIFLAIIELIIFINVQ